MSDIKVEGLYCPECGEPHVDVGQWATKPHHKHLCHHCFHIWDVHPYTCGSGAYRDGGKSKLRAEGFESGCLYSAIEITALRAEREDLKHDIGEALKANTAEQLDNEKLQARYIKTLEIVCEEFRYLSRPIPKHIEIELATMKKGNSDG